MKTLIIVEYAVGPISILEVEGDKSHLDGVVIGQGGSENDYKLQNELLSIIRLREEGLQYPTKDWDHCIRVEYL